MNKKIVSLTLNPSIDKRYVIKEFKFGSVMRVADCNNVAGGKGINLTKALSVIGGDVKATGIVGGYNGKYLVSFLDNLKIPHDFFYTDKETRSCINFYDEKTGVQSEFLEQGELIGENEIAAFIEHFKNTIVGAKMVTMSGSAPKGFPKDIYKTLIKICNDQNIKVVLDVSGDYLKHGIEALPFMVKPNVDEIAQLSEIESCDEVKAIETAKKYIDKGLEQFVISLGKDGAILVRKNEIYRGVPSKIKTVNTVGCGDAMSAAFAYASICEMTPQQQLEFAIKVASASAMCEVTGSLNKNDINKIEVKISAI